MDELWRAVVDMNIEFGHERAKAYLMSLGLDSNKADESISAAMSINNNTGGGKNGRKKRAKSGRNTV